MTFQVRDQKEFLAGAIFTVIGVVWAFRAMALPLGTATAMGPGYFPLVVAIVLACTGLLSVGRSLRVAQTHALEPWNIMAIAFVLIGITVFALLIDRVGVVAGTIVLIVLSSPVRLLQKPLEVILLAAFTAAFVAALFVYALGLTLPLF
jgi:hypothetical protein